MCPTGAEWDAAVASWRELKSDEGAKYDRIVEIAAADIAPTVTWGTSPQDVTSIEGTVPIPDDPARGGSADPARQAGIKRSLEYMGLKGGERMQDLKVDKVRRRRRLAVAAASSRFTLRVFSPARPPGRRRAA
jgi:homoaconitase/3-isopropylmalate dehydratase large subunit